MNTNTNKNTIIESAIEEARNEWVREARKAVDAENMADFVEGIRMIAACEMDLSKEVEIPEGLTQEDMRHVLICAAREFLIEDAASEMYSAWEIEDMPDAKTITDMAELMSEQSQWEHDEIRKLIGDYCHR